MATEVLHESLPKFTTVNLADITVPSKRLRSMGDLTALADSMRQVGLLNPVLLTRDNRLVAGLHRVKAAELLGWTEIAATRIAVGELEAQLAEIDENLVRNELTALERSEHVAKRKEVYEALHPETRKGVSQARGMNRSLGSNVSENISPTFATDTAAKTGTSRRTVEQEAKIGSAIAEDVRDALRDTPLAYRKDDLLKIARMEPEEQRNVAKRVKQDGAKTLKEAKECDRKEALKTAQSQITETAREQLDAVCEIRHCGMADLLSDCTPDCIITDPPYPREHLHLFGELAEAAKRVPLVAVMCGQSYLPDVLALMCKHLTYRWTLAYLTPGGQSVQLWDRKVNTFWKPVLLFGDSVEWIGDVTRSNTNDNDKKFHHWGQSESGTADLVERLTKPGQLVCDPFVGGGTTAMVSLDLGRRFIGCDIDHAAVESARLRCEALYANR